jgi:hypothetical protein
MGALGWFSAAFLPPLPLGMRNQIGQFREAQGSIESEIKLLSCCFDKIFFLHTGGYPPRPKSL